MTKPGQASVEGYACRLLRLPLPSRSPMNPRLSRSLFGATLLLGACQNAPSLQGPAVGKSVLAVAGAPGHGRIQWLLADQEAGPYAPLEGVRGKRCVLPAVFANRWIKAQVVV